MMPTWTCATCGPVPAGEIRHLDHNSPTGQERHECGSSAGLDWTKTKEHAMTTTPTWRDYTLEQDGMEGGVAVLCRSDSDCYENQPNEPGRYLTLGEAVDWAQKHAADHARWDAEVAADQALTDAEGHAV